MTNDNAKTTAQLFDKFHEVAMFDRYATMLLSDALDFITTDEELTARFKQYVYNMPEDIADIEYGSSIAAAKRCMTHCCIASQSCSSKWPSAMAAILLCGHAVDLGSLGLLRGRGGLLRSFYVVV